MDYNKTIDELKRAWDALEEMPVRGYAARARITLAQEMILSVYNQAAEARRKEEADRAEEQPAEE